MGATINRHPALQELYGRLMAAKDPNRAKVAVACKLLTIAFQLLCDGRCCERRTAATEGISPGGGKGDADGTKLAIQLLDTAARGARPLS